MAEEVSVVLRRSECSGFGFSLLGKPGMPPIIYHILDDSPAAESGEVEIGDVILKVNETDVDAFSTKEVLKCLRLSADPVTLTIKRDPTIKASVRQHLLAHDEEQQSSATSDNGLAGAPAEPRKANGTATSNGNGGSSEQQQQQLQWEPLGGDKPKAKYEAFMMTGEHILNISKTQPPPSIGLPKQLRYLPTSMPNSPNELELGYRNHHNYRHRNHHHHHHQNHHHHSHHSATTSPVFPSANKRNDDDAPPTKATFNNFVRTSRSEDQLQDTQMANAVDIDVDDDITSSLNTLLDTRLDLAAHVSDSDLAPSNGSGSSSGSSGDRIVWTYNAPVAGDGEHHRANGSSSSPTTTSPLRSDSPQSPTSVSSSVMSSHSGSRRVQPPYVIPNGPAPGGGGGGLHTNGGDYSMSEAISNISSPDYNDEDSMGMRDCVMEISDHSDSDSTLLVSEPRQRRPQLPDHDHRIVIQVKGPAVDKDKDTVKDRGKYRRDQVQQVPLEVFHFDDDDDAEERALLDSTASDFISSSPVSEDDSDVDSLHSFHYSPKAVDMPSAIRLANRLYNLDGFKKSDVSRHLSKNNEFSRAVADEYLKHFNFDQDTLDIALRKFLKQFSLTGETQERERVLVHFSKRFLDCNPGSFNSQDAVHTLTCAIMLLNTDLHTQNINRKMTCHEFIENLAGLNENDNFPREVLKQLYHAIKTNPLEWAIDEEDADGAATMQKPTEQHYLAGNPFLDVPCPTNSIEYKKGYVMRKCCYETNAKRTPFHKRSWKMFYCTLRDLVLYLHKDENGFRKNQMGDNLHNAIRIHHALATKATDYTKKQYVFRLQTADQAEYLFQTSDSKELQSWIDTINFVCACFSAPPLEAAVGSQKKFQRPLLPCSHTTKKFRDQLLDHEERVLRLDIELDEHRRSPPERNAKSLAVQNYKEREAYLHFELKRYKAYVYILRSRISQYPDMGVSLVESSIGELDEASAGHPGDAPVTPHDTLRPVVALPGGGNARSPQTNRKKE